MSAPECAVCGERIDYESDRPSEALTENHQGIVHQMCAEPEPEYEPGRAYRERMDSIRADNPSLR